jgi:multicomponent Na+:H+ antiporter subunit G
VIVLVGLLFAAGLFFQAVGAVGLVRFPDVFSRQHVVCITDTLGAPLMLLAAAVDVGPGLVAAKLLLAVVLSFVTGPLVSHMLARAALETGLGNAGPNAARDGA